MPNLKLLEKKLRDWSRLNQESSVSLVLASRFSAHYVIKLNIFAGSVEAQVAVVRTEQPVAKPMVSLVEQQFN